jgi:hypothetical protein
MQGAEGWGGFGDLYRCHNELEYLHHGNVCGSFQLNLQ